MRQCQTNIMMKYTSDEDNHIPFKDVVSWHNVILWGHFFQQFPNIILLFDGFVINLIGSNYQYIRHGQSENNIAFLHRHLQKLHRE